MLKRFIALLCALTLTVTTALALATSPAHADHDGDNVPDEFEVSGWWNNPSNTTSTAEQKWTYANFPVTCNTDSSLPAIQVLWVTKPGQTPFVDDPVKLGKIRDDFNRVASVYAASAQKHPANNAELLTDKTPRFITWTSGSGRCYPTFTKVEIPASTYDAGVSAIWAHLRSIGYNAANRKYLSMIQTPPANDPAWPYAGIAEHPGYYDGADKTVNNDANNGSHLLAVAYSTSIGGWMAKTLAHEIGHALGALAQYAPNRNTSNGAHPKDCMEIMCYTPLNQTAGQLDICGQDNMSNPTAFRLDCNRDDYWKNNPTSGYLLTNFNVNTDSTYIWGGGSTSGFAPRATNGATVFVDDHSKHDHANHDLGGRVEAFGLH